MGSDSPLKDWFSLVSEWKGEAVDDFNEDGVVEGCHIFRLEPSEGSGETGLEKKE